MKINRQNYESYFLDYAEGQLEPTLVAELMVFLADNPDLAEELDLLDATPLEIPKVEYDAKASLKKPELPMSEDAMDEFLVREVEGDLTPSELNQLMQWEKEFPYIATLRNIFSRSRWIAGSEKYPWKDELLFPAEIDYSDPNNLLVGKIEGDLNASQQLQLEKMLHETPALQHELELLRRTRLQPEAITFEEKDSLRRKATRVVPMGRYFAYTAAAASVALLLWIGGATDSTTGRIAEKGSLNLPARSFTATENTNIASYVSTAVHPGISEVAVALPGAITSVATTHNEVSKSAFNKLEKLNATAIAVNAKRGGIVPKEHGGDITPNQISTASLHPTTPSTPEEYPSLLKFFEQKAKARLWGSEEYPEDKFALALAERTIERQSEKEDSPVAFEQKKEDDGKWYRLRIGKVEFERKSKK